MEPDTTGAHAEQELGKAKAFMPVENKARHSHSCFNVYQKWVMARALARLATACAISHCMI